MIRRFLVPLAVPIVMFMVGGESLGQSSSPPARTPVPPAATRQEVDRTTLRLFERFIEDAVLTPVWAEFQYRYDNGEDSNAQFLGPLLAFRVSPRLEAGVTFGYKDVESETQPEGSGLSDIDLYLKYVTPGGRANRWAFGGVLKAPTADEDQGLGTGKTDLEVFGAWRLNLGASTLTANLAFRYNGSASTPAGNVDDTFLIGVGLISPATPRVAIIVEAAYETERFEGSEGESSALSAGVQVAGRKGRGGFRASAGLPLSGGASDLILVGGAYFAVGEPRTQPRPAS